ncbi:unnamed protein product [Orchesella dallaii]|uniref:Glutamate-gated chloride channel n=1 Tax=Orchesella dallaii TaxID=48710 RepID=A0ABP1Q0M0_9HEXA
MNFKTFIIFIFAAFTINETTAQKAVNPEGAILERLIPNFNKLSRVRPVRKENITAPVSVSVNLYIRSIRILTNDNEYSVQLTFRQQWRDERLSYSSQDSNQHVSLINSKNDIWQPDAFFSNEIDGKYHELMMRNEFIRISPNGNVMKSVRISLRLRCPMNYRKFPFDRQTCSIRLASYGYTTRDLVFVWDNENPVQQTANDFTMPTFVLEQVTTDYCDSITKTGAYSCLRVDLTFQRLFTPYLVGVYIPSTMMVLTSWVSFWISPKAVTARTILATLTLFVLAIQTAEVNKSFPQTGYTKAVDKWTGICLTFVFAALLEFATVHYLSNRKEKNSCTAAGSKDDDNAAIESNDGGGDEEQEIPLKDINSSDGNKGDQGQKEEITQRARRLAENLISELEASPHRMDVVSRVAFPGVFVLFNIFYWLVYSF